MESLTFAGDKVKATIPKSLYQSIIRIQAADDLDFDKACVVAGKLVDPRRIDFEKSVEDTAERLGKSRFMKQLNKTRKKIGEKEHRKGFNEGYLRGKQYFKYPCSICDEPIPLSDKSWEPASQFLTEKGWGHAKCHNNRTQDF